MCRMTEFYLANFYCVSFMFILSFCQKKSASFSGFSARIIFNSQFSTLLRFLHENNLFPFFTLLCYVFAQPKYYLCKAQSTTRISINSFFVLNLN